MTDTPEPYHSDRIASVLQGILRLGVETKDLGALISRIRGLLGGLMDTTNFFVALYDPDTETYRFPFFADQHEDADPDLCEALPKGLTDYVRRTGKPALVDENQHAELIVRCEAEFFGAESKQWMGVPLETGNGVIGVVALQSYDDPTLYSAEDLELLHSVAGTISVVVERNNAEQELRKSRENLSLIFDTIGDVLFQLQVEGENSYRFASVNSSFLKATGLREDQVVGKPVEEVIPESARELVFGKYAQAIRKRSTVTWQEVSTCPTGDLTGIASVTPSFDGNGTCTHLVGSVHDITDQMRAIDALRKSKDKLRSITESSADHIMLLDTGKRILFVNHPVPDLKPEEVLGANILDFTPSAMQKVAVACFDRVAQTGTPSRYETDHITTTGERRFFDVRIGPVIEDGELVGFVSSSTDITLRREAEGQATRLGRILEEAVNEIYVFDAGTLLFTQVNRGARENLDYSIEELKDMTPLDLKPEFTAETFAAMIEPLNTGEENAVRFTTVHRRKDGSTYPVEVHLQLFKGEVDPVFVAIILDITERQEAQAELLLKNKVFEVSLTANSTADVDGILNHVNNAFLRIWGLDDRAEAIGRPIGEFMESEVKATEIITALNQIGAWEGEFTALRKDGTTIPVSSTATVIKNENGDIVGYQSSVLDISERKLAEEALAEHQAHLEHEVMRRTADLRKAVDLMAGRENRMADLKSEMRELRAQLEKYEE